MVSTARALLTHGAAIDAVCFASRTPLHEACHAANLNIVRLLCEEGASVNALEGEGFEFWELCKVNGGERVCKDVVASAVGRELRPGSTRLAKAVYTALGLSKLLNGGRTYEAQLHESKRFQDFLQRHKRGPSNEAQERTSAAQCSNKESY